MSFNICALSGNSIEVPVVSKKTGHVFEKSLIEKHIELTNQCPITGEELRKEDLLELKIHKATKPRTTTTTSVPGLLNQLQSEWDTLMLEQFNVKDDLNVAKSELSTTLYQFDASNRVIGRLLKERNETRDQLYSIRSLLNITEEEEEKESKKEGEIQFMGIHKQLLEKIKNLSVKLSSERKKRGKPKESKSTDSIAAFKCTNTFNFDSGNKYGVSCLDFHKFQDNFLIVGESSGKFSIMDLKKNSLHASQTVHSKKINDIQFQQEANFYGVLVGSADSTVTFNVFSPENSNFTQAYKSAVHKEEVSSVCFHPLGDYALAASRDSYWSFHNIAKGLCLEKVKSVLGQGISKARVHPDGVVFATGEMDGCVRIWDINTNSNVAAFEGDKSEVSGLSFSENGYYLATCSNTNVVKLYDLRKPKNFKNIEFEEKAKIKNVNFDFSGNYLGVVGSNVSIWNTLNWESVASFDDHTALVTDIKFSSKTKLFATSSQDKSVKIFSA